MGLGNIYARQRGNLSLKLAAVYSQFVLIHAYIFILRLYKYKEKEREKRTRKREKEREREKGKRKEHYRHNERHYADFSYE